MGTQKRDAHPLAQIQSPAVVILAAGRANRTQRLCVKAAIQNICSVDKYQEFGYDYRKSNIEYRISEDPEKVKGLSALQPPVNSSSQIISYGNVHDAVVDRIREMILNGQLKPGDRLRQDELAKTFGVSAMPIREALRKLQAEGLVIFYPRRGATVANISVSDYEEIYHIREELEVLACRWAAEDFDRIPLERLKHLLEEVEVAETSLDVPRRMQLVREFFFLIFSASQKQHLLRILSSLWDLSQQYRRFFSSMPEVVPQRLANYRNVYRACEARDPQALVSAIRAICAFGRNTLIPRLHQEEAKKQNQ
jgi:DNA-binding GntR family transcriptional regulator